MKNLESSGSAGAKSTTEIVNKFRQLLKKYRSGGSVSKDKLTDFLKELHGHVHGGPKNKGISKGLKSAKKMKKKQKKMLKKLKKAYKKNKKAKKQLKKLKKAVKGV